MLRLRSRLARGLSGPVARAGCCRGRGEHGSGTAIGVAMMFPMLMMAIVLIQMLSDSTRSEQALQATANRAARTASLCCYRIDGDGGAAATVRAGLESATAAGARNRIFCNNDTAGTPASSSSTRPATRSPPARSRRGNGPRVPDPPNPAQDHRRLRHPRPRHRAPAGGRGHLVVHVVARGARRRRSVHRRCLQPGARAADPPCPRSIRWADVRSP